MISLRRAGHVYSAGTPWAHRALTGIDLAIDPGERLVVVGRNGSGKSTLAWILAGLLVPSEGTATMDGAPLDRVPGRTAIAFQHARLQLFRPTVGADVAFGTSLDAGGVDRALELVGLEPGRFRDRRVDELSGGEQRRVALAGVLARRPRLLVLDEPLAGLDAPSRAGLVDVLARLHAATQVATVVVTHDLDSSSALGDRVVALDGGRLIGGGPHGSRALPVEQAGVTNAAGWGRTRRGRRAAKVERPRSTATAELNLLRHVPGASPVHRMWAGTKLVVVTAVTAAVALRPTWSSEAVAAVLLALAVLAARIPRGAVPRLPRWFLGAVAIGAAAGLSAGGDPQVGGFALGGLLEWLRLTLLGVLVLGFAALFGWTTPLSELTPALDRLLRPFRRVRVPVDELVAMVGLAVRCVPLLVEELRTVMAARRLRVPVEPTGLRAQVVAAHDMLVTTVVSAVRRGRDLADAIEARGGWHHGAVDAVRLGWPDAVALALAAGAVVAVVLL